MKRMLNLIKNDSWLEPYQKAIEGRYQQVLKKERELTENGKQSLSNFASGYLYYGLHRTDKGWVFREWAPNAQAIYLTGTFNGWQQREDYKLTRLTSGNWETCLPDTAIHHGDLYKLIIHWDGGWGERIPAWVRRVVQDPHTKIYSAQVWCPEK
ncbi:MAG: 1,4-alpha-glucan-branching enzyme, partial [Bacteroidales bacterium]|nr:1,4-alpha-glucan-branching enzyme [Bacteroidales bacterium]